MFNPPDLHADHMGQAQLVEIEKKQLSCAKITA
jgi:hypothetical protein